MFLAYVSFVLLFVFAMSSAPFLFPIWIIMLFALMKAASIGRKKLKDERKREEEAFRNQKVKFKTMHRLLRSDLEKDVNKFIRDKNVINVTFDEEKYGVTATILYEEEI